VESRCPGAQISAPLHDLEEESRPPARTALSPMPFTCISCSRLWKGPFALRYSTQIGGHHLIQAGDVPQQRNARRVQGQRRLKLTHDSTTPSKAFAQLFGTYVMLIETDADVLGSIFTSSLSGSCKRRPMEIVPRQRGVEVRELLPADRTGRVDAGAGLR